MKKYFKLLVVLFVFLVLVMSACSPQEQVTVPETAVPQTSGTTADTAQEESEAPLTPEQTQTVASVPEASTSQSTEEGSPQGGHVKNLIVGITQKPEGASIGKQAGMFGRFNYNSIVTANFFYPDKNGIAQPYFLDSFEVSEDGSELTMTFPTTAIWHDGMPVTVDDVVFTFEYYRDVKKSSKFKTLTDIKINGENSVTLVFSKPVVYSFIQSSFLTFGVLPKHIWQNIEDYSAYAGEDAAIGCGPYRLVEIDEDAGTMYYEAVPENAYLGELTVDSITLKSYSSFDSLLMAMANGEIDVMYSYSSPVNYTLLEVIAGNDDLDLGASDYAGNYQVTMGMNRDANMVYEFREAVVKSLNWSLITQIINGEYGQIPGSGIIAPPNVGFDSSLWSFYQDVDEAKALLDAAGFIDADNDGYRDLPDGTSFTYKVAGQYAATKQELINRIGEILVSSLTDVGINAYYDTASLASSEANNQLRVDTDYDMYIGYTTTGIASYSTSFFYFVNKTVEGGGGALGEGWGDSYNNDELNAAYTAMKNAANKEEYITAVKIMQRLASEELFAFSLCWEQCFFPYRTDKYQGFQNYPSIGVIHAETFYQITNK